MENAEDGGEEPSARGRPDAVGAPTASQGVDPSDTSASTTGARYVSNDEPTPKGIDVNADSSEESGPVAVGEASGDRAFTNADPCTGKRKSSVDLMQQYDAADAIATGLPSSSRSVDTSSRTTRRTSIKSLEASSSPPSRSDLGDGDVAGGTDANYMDQRSRRVRRKVGSSYSHQHDESSASAVGTVADNMVQAYVRDADVMILSNLDNKSYQLALLRDSNTYLNNVLFPMNFPWHDANEPLIKSVPNDIEELYGVIYADSDYASARKCSEGPVPDMFGYGKCEIGQERQQGMIPNFAMRGYDSIVVAARRANDPGQIEVTATMPPPPSLDAALFSCDQAAAGILPTQSIEETDTDTLQTLKALVEANRAAAASSMPMYCRAVDGSNYFNPPAFIESIGNAECDGIDDGDDEGPSSDFESGYSDMFKRDRQLKQRKELSKACSRKWKVSIKVGGTSSRSRIFTPKSGMNRPMLRTALLPVSILSGQSVSMEAAAQMDKSGLSKSLGSYDYRYPQVSKSTSGKASGGSSSKKKVLLGRTRLIWTRKNEKVEGASKYGKSTYTSIITGQKLDTNAQKRKREIRVGVRLNGLLISEQHVRDEGDTGRSPHAAGGKKSGRKTKHSDVLCSVAPSAVPASDDRNSGEIDRAVRSIFSDIDESPTKKGDGLERPASQQHIECFESAMLVTKVALQIKRTKKRNAKKICIGDSDDKKDHAPQSVDSESTQYVSMKYGAGPALRHVEPRLALLPLDDGLLRGVCVAPGTMQGASVHKMLRAAANAGGEEKFCSVCWSNEADAESVQECIDCGLLVHLACCESKGELIRSPDNPEGGNLISATTSTRFSSDICAAPESKCTWEVSDSNVPSSGEIRWRCAVCNVSNDTQLGKPTDDPKGESVIALKKPRRASKLPARFCDGESNVLTLTSSTSKSAWTRPSPKCSLCPHSGGAMSMLGSSCGWTHDVCRTWSQCEAAPSTADISGFSLEHPSSSVVCALCGLSGSITHREKKEAADTLQTDLVESKANEERRGILPPGLIMCAAKGCGITFHPMCATLATRLLPHPAGSTTTRKVHKGSPGGVGQCSGFPKATSMKERRMVDVHLCKQYTLTLIDVKHGNDSDCVAASSIVPIAFCGLHNPERESEFYGRLPGGHITQND